MTKERDQMRYPMKFKMMMLCLLIAGPAAATTVSERIFFMEDDGLHCKYYINVQSDASNRGLLFHKKTENRNPEEYLNDFLYVYPNEYQWDIKGYELYDRLEFSSGTYAVLSLENLSDRVTIGDDGIYTFDSRSVKEEAASDEGNYGFFTTPGNFSEFMSVWVFPQIFQVIEYQCNREGKWKKRRNTISFFGENVNNLVFTIRYRLSAPVPAEGFGKIAEEQAEYLRIETEKEGIRIILAAGALFPSGTSELTEIGKTVIEKIAAAVAGQTLYHIIIEGHTDNQPVSAETAEKYATNWELSAARSLSVLRELAEKGVPEASMEVRAYGSQRPRVSNESPEGRAQNRRIELLVRQAEMPPAAPPVIPAEPESASAESAPAEPESETHAP